LLHRLQGGVLHGTHNKIRHGAPLQLSGALEHGVQIGADPSLESSGRSGGSHDVFLFVQIVRQIAVFRKRFGAAALEADASESSMDQSVRDMVQAS
jgi:hypothetical protein